MINHEKSRLSRNSVLYGAAVLAASGMLMQLLGFLYRIALTGFIGAEGMGVYSLVFPVYGVIVSVSLSGLSMAVGNLSSGQFALKNYDGMRRLVRTAIMTFTALFAVMAVPTVMYRDEIAKYVLGDERTARALLVFMPCILLTGLENICKAVFYGVRRVNRPVVSELCEQVLRITAVCGLLWLLDPKDPGTAAAIIIFGMTISEVFSSTFMAISCHKFLKRLGPGGSPAGLNRAMLSIALPVSAVALANNLINSANTVMLPERLMAGGMTREAAVSALGVVSGMAAPLIMLPISLISAMATVISPRIAASTALGDANDTRRKTEKAMEMTGLLIMPASAILLPLSPLLCRLFFNQQVSELYMALLTAGSLLGAFQIISVSVLNGMGHQRRAMLHVVAGGILHLMLMWNLAANPNFLIYGFLVSDILGTILTVVMNFRLIRRSTDMRPPWKKSVIYPALLSVITGLFVRAAYMYLSFWGINDWLCVSVPAFFGGVIFLILIRISGYRPMRYISTCISRT